MTDIDTLTPETIGKRIKDARDSAGLSRARLGDLTKISPRVIEKIEAGTQEASATRLRALCSALKIDPAEFLGTGKPASAQTAEGHDLLAFDPMDRASLILEEIDGLRSDGFEGSTRKAMALATMAKEALSHLEPEDLNRLARLRGLARHDTVDGLTILDLFNEAPCKGHEYCGFIEDRIVDTAVIGLDLYALDEAQAHALAEELADMDRLERPGLLSDWPEMDRLYPRIQPIIRRIVTAGKTLKHLTDDPAI